MEIVFLQLAIILLLAFLISYVVRVLGQPIIIGYIFAGILISPFFIQFGASSEVIHLFSKIGIAFLLFIVGLHLNPKVIKEIGSQSLLIGLGQVILTFVVGFVMCYKILNFDFIASIFLSIGIAFSSTIIVMKLLLDKKQLDSLFGKISIGILIIQDFLAIFILMVISSIGGKTDLASMAINTILWGIILIAGVFIFGFLVLLRVVKSVARSQELLFLFSICWCFVIAALFSLFNFSLEIGALIAGMVLSISPYTTEISSKIKPLRDFFLIIFFIILGLNLNISSIKEIALNSIILSAAVLVFKPIIIMTLMGSFGYTKRTSFFTGMSLAQISEFSLIILLLAVSFNMISVEILYTLTLSLILTILISTYFITYSKNLYRRLFKVISVFEKKNIKKRKRYPRGYKTILFGYNRTGFNILRALSQLKKKYLIVDFNPDTISNLKKFRIPCLYGDADDPELLNNLYLDKIDLAISTIPDFETNFLLIETIRLVNSNAIIISRAENIHDALALYKKGADYVLTPLFLGGDYIAKMIKSKANKKSYEKEKQKHIKVLEGILKKSRGGIRESYLNHKFI